MTGMPPTHRIQCGRLQVTVSCVGGKGSKYLLWEAKVVVSSVGGCESPYLVWEGGCNSLYCVVNQEAASHLQYLVWEGKLTLSSVGGCESHYKLIYCGREAATHFTYFTVS